MRHTQKREWSAVEQMEQETADLKAGTEMWRKAYTESVSESTERLLRIQKLESENAEFKKKLANRKKLKKLLLDVHNCEGCGHRCVLHVDAWCDIIEDLMEQELSEKQKGMK